MSRKVIVRTRKSISTNNSGYGGSAIWLARTLGCQVKEIGIVPEQIEEAERFARHHRVSNLVQFERMDFTQTAYPDASFDVVWALESIVHTERKAGFLQEAHRLLRPGAVC